MGRRKRVRNIGSTDYFVYYMCVCVSLAVAYRDSVENKKNPDDRTMTDFRKRCHRRRTKKKKRETRVEYDEFYRYTMVI